jgi:RNA polymerase sigma-70 factor (ECF subfamily)
MFNEMNLMYETNGATSIEQDNQSNGADDIDNELLKSIARKRDRTSMERFYQRYRKKLGSFLYGKLLNSALTDEVYNEVMMVVWQKAEQFNGQSKVSTWVFSIAYRQCLQMFRNEKKHASEDIDEHIIAIDQIPNEDEQQLVQMAFKGLSIDHRSVIELSYFVGCNYKEIGEIAGCSENTIKTRMFYAKRNLRTNLIRLGALEFY